MQDYTTILDVVRLRLNGCPYDVTERRCSIGSSTVALIMNRYQKIGLSYDELKAMDPQVVENLFYPPQNLARRSIPEPDFQYYYDRIHADGSTINISFCWIEYRKEHPDGYGSTQFYERYKRFVETHYGGQTVKMPVERVPGEKMYIDWVGDQPELLVDLDTGEIQKVHIFTTTLGISNYIYAEVFMDEKLPQFITGTVHALQHYQALPKYLVPDNLKTAITKHSKDQLILQSAYGDLEDFYDVIVLPPPPRKPKGKATVEAHVKFLETHLIGKLKEFTFTSLEEINAKTKEIVADLNNRKVQRSQYTRKESFEKYDKPCMKPLPGGNYAICEYKPFNKVPDNYHLDFDNHYYSVLYTYKGKPAILKATQSEIRICDQYNRLICRHKRAYREFPKYITEDEHMPPEHLYYKEVNAKNGAYYRRWAAVFGPNMAEFIDRLLKSYKHEEQGYNSCNGILHFVKDKPHGIVEDVASACLEMNTCSYSAFKRILQRSGQTTESIAEKSKLLPVHENIRGKDYYG